MLHLGAVLKQELERAASSAPALARGYDVPARFGADEFCLLLPEPREADALAVAERVRSGAERAGRERGLSFTLSVGVAEARVGRVSADELIGLADRAVYRAKFSGRNTVAVAPRGEPVDEAERVLADAARSER